MNFPDPSPTAGTPNGGLQNNSFQAGYDNSNGYRFLTSEPVANYNEALAAVMGVSIAYERGTAPLLQNPDQTRSLTLRFLVDDINQTNVNFDMYLTQMYWALYNP
jgi:hypothetical protein